jgi:multidrug efflux pump subunit AcrA (membrane-fusion protein)
MKRWMMAYLVLLLWGCSATPTPLLPTVVFQTQPAVGQSAGGGMTASGVVVAAQQAQLAFSIGGRVTRVLVTAGDSVKAGAALVELDPTAAERELAQAQLELANLTSPLAIANAELAVAQAQKTFDDAESNYNDFVLDYKKGALRDAKDWFAQASERYYYLIAHQDGSPAGQAQLQQAYQEYLRALQAVQAAEHNYETNHASGTAAAQSTIAILTAQYDIAKAALAEAQAYLAAVRGGQIPANTLGTNIQILSSAHDRVTAAREQLLATRMVAPFDGTVTAVHASPGENILPGAIMLTVSDLSRLHIETTDLSERDVPSIQAGQTVTVQIKALDKTFAGHVRLVLPLAEILGGDVVYRVIIDLDSPSEMLRAGMSAEIAFGK